MSKNDNTSMIISALINAKSYPSGRKLEKDQGFSKTNTQKLLDKYFQNRAYQPNKDELLIIKNCFEACIKNIDARGFPVIFDFEKEHVEKFYKEFFPEKKD